MDLGFNEEDLKLGRHIKKLTTSRNIIKDVSAAINWVKEKYPKKKISIIGFSLGSYAAFIASSLKGIESTFCFYGEEFIAPRTDTNFAPLDLIEKVSGKLNFICGSLDD